MPSTPPAPLAPKPPLAKNRWFLRLLQLLPVAIAVLWLAGVAQFRGYEFSPFEWATLVAVAFALRTLTVRFQRPRPLPALPPGTNPVTLAALAAAIIGGLAALVGGALEAVVDTNQPTDTPWLLRTAWHAASAFAAGYCGFLQRLVTSPRT